MHLQNKKGMIYGPCQHCLQYAPMYSVQRDQKQVRLNHPGGMGRHARMPVGMIQNDWIGT